MHHPIFVNKAFQTIHLHWININNYFSTLQKNMDIKHTLIIAKQSQASFYLMGLATPVQVSESLSYTVSPKPFKYINA